MRFLIVGDLHGSKPRIHYKGFDAVIAPGDFCSDTAKKYAFEAVRQTLKTGTKTTWFDLVGKKKAKGMIKDSLAQGRKILEFLDSLSAPVFVVPGNWDHTGFREGEWGWRFIKENHFKDLLKGLKNIRNVHHRTKPAGGYQIIGHGISSGPEYPQYKEDLERLKPRELKKRKNWYESGTKKVAGLFEKARKPVVFLSHNVPFNTPLDKITNPESPKCGYHYGSLIVREAIEKYQPLVSVGGHMHEHFGKCRLGKTVCINTGFGPRVNTWLELEGARIKKLEFWRG